MVPDKFNMVDMEGIDIITSQGEEIPGLYQKLVESIAQCRYQCIYNWKFDGILIPPTYVEMTIIDDVVWINEGVSVDEEDVIRIYSLEPPAPEPNILELSVTENGTYVVPEGYDGYNPVTVNVPSYTPVINPLSIIENGTYTASSGVDGYSPISVNVPSGGVDVTYIKKWLNTYATGLYKAPDYIDMGIERNAYIYSDESLITAMNLTLLGDFSQQGSSAGNQLLDSLLHYTAIILQGIYNGQRTSIYNTSMLYIEPVLNTNYWAGMKDRNSSYTCTVVFTSDTECSLSGNRRVIIYGVP